MEIIDNVCYLTVGDKVKHMRSNEGGTIIEVMDKDRVVVEFFEENKIMKSNEVNAFTLLSTQSYQKISFYTQKKRKSSKEITKVDIVSNTIDLHAEVLFPNYRTMSSENIAIQQISRLAHYLDQVLDSDLFEIEIIHGKGSGSLRSQVVDLLENKYNLFNLDISDKGKTKVVL